MVSAVQPSIHIKQKAEVHEEQREQNKDIESGGQKQRADELETDQREQYAL
jgi:hypothetical protein